MPDLRLVVIRGQDMHRLGEFYATLGLQFTKHRHGTGPEHLSCTIGETVFEIYPAGAGESTASTRLGFSVRSLANTLEDLRKLDVNVLVKPADTPFGRR